MNAECDGEPFHGPTSNVRGAAAATMETVPACILPSTRIDDSGDDDAEEDFFFFAGGTSSDGIGGATAHRRWSPKSVAEARSQTPSDPVGSTVGPSSQCDGDDSPVSDLLEDGEACDDPRPDCVSDADDDAAQQSLLPRHLCPDSAAHSATMDDSEMNGSVSMLTEDDEEDDVRSDMAVEPVDDEDEGGDTELGAASAAASSAAQHRPAHYDESSDSSSSFTHDEWWDWLDNLTVAFIEINDGGLSDERDEEDSRKKGKHVKTKRSQYHSDEVPHNTSTELTVPNTSYDGTEPETEEPSFSWDVTMESAEPPSVELDQTSSARGSSHVRGTWELAGACKDWISLAPSDEGVEDEPNSLPLEIVHWQQPPTVPPPILRHCASVADFRSAQEQQSRLLQASGAQLSRMKRSVSFKDLDVSAAPLPPVDCTLTQLRRISSNENLLLTLQSRIQSPLRAKIDPTEGRIVSFDAERSHRKVWSSFCRLTTTVVMAVYAISAFHARTFETVTEPEMVDTCQPRVVSLDLDSVSFDGPVEVASDVYHYIVDHLSDKPRVVSIDIDTYASIAYEDAKYLLRTAGSAVSNACHAVYDQLEPPRLRESLRSLALSMLEANHALLKKASEACVSRQWTNQTSGLRDACSTVMDRLPEVRKLLALDWAAESSLAERLHLYDALHVLKNETSYVMDALSAFVHSLIDGSFESCQENDSDFRSDWSSEKPYAVKVLSNFTPVLSHPAASPPKSRNRSSVCTIARPFQYGANAATSKVFAPFLSNVTAIMSVPLQLIAGLKHPGKGDSSSNKPAEPTTSQQAQKVAALETKRRVKAILSRLDANGRLQELEAVLLEKFGQEARSIQQKSKLPLLGKYREEQLRELWLRNMERQIVGSTLGKNAIGSDALWQSFRGKFKNLIDSIDRGVKRWNIEQMKLIRELQSFPLSLPIFNSSVLNELWLLDIGNVFRHRGGERRARGLARFEWLNELWLIDDEDVLQDFGLRSIK